MLSKNLGLMKSYQSFAFVIHILKPPCVKVVLFYSYILISLYYLKHVGHLH